MTTKPLAIDLYCGLGGWTEGLLAEGFQVVGFDIVRHAYGEHRYPAQLVLQDVTTLIGSQFKDAALIVASPPCQEYSYMAMPWKIAKAKAQNIRADATGAKLAELNRLFDACFRIQREACAAAGRHIPLVVENVRGAQPWVGRSRWAFGSYHLWGDVPALMPMSKNIAKCPGHDWNRFKQTGEVSPHWRLNGEHSRLANRGIKNSGGSWFNIAHDKISGCGNNPTGRPGRNDPRSAIAHSQSSPRSDGTKCGGDWFNGKSPSDMRHHNSKSSKRKMASAMIAKIPLALASHIARTYYPR